MIEWFLKLMDKIKVPFNVKRVTGLDYYQSIKILQPGDIILTTTKGWFVNWLNPSEYKHGAIYLGGGDIKYVMEATAKGVVKTDLITFLLSKDYFIIKQHPDIQIHERKQICKLVESLEGTPYDFTFTKNNNKYYCFELIGVCYSQVMMQPKIRQVKICGKLRYISQSFTRWITKYNSEENE